MDWSWASFAAGVVVGLSLMWIAVALSARGEETDGDTERWR